MKNAWLWYGVVIVSAIGLLIVGFRAWVYFHAILHRAAGVPL